MARVSVKVEGIEKTIANLKKWQTIKRQAVADVNKTVAAKVERQAKAGCPNQTGRLMSSMSFNWSGSGMNRARPTGRVPPNATGEDTVGEPAGEKGMVAVVGSNVKYAHMMEFGTWGDGPKPGPGERPESTPERRKREQQRRQPLPPGGFQMLTKAYLAHEKEYVRRIEAAIGKDENIK